MKIENAVLHLESVNEECLPVNAFLQHIPEGKLYYAQIRAHIDEVTLSYLSDVMRNQFKPEISELVKDWIELQKENNDVEVTDDTVVMITGDTKTVLHFSVRGSSNEN